MIFYFEVNSADHQNSLVFSLGGMEAQVNELLLFYMVKDSLHEKHSQYSAAAAHSEDRNSSFAKWRCQLFLKLVLLIYYQDSQFTLLMSL